mmetsp:Transcript_56677/g.164365  ORF Transcript_56677/g.164365 Transcript_56677/m.164365 type:complete len:232 (+) Transcript_56677:116-811(+)
MVTAAVDHPQASARSVLAPLSARAFVARRPSELAVITGPGSPIGVIAGAALGSITSERSGGAGAETGSSSCSSPRIRPRVNDGAHRMGHASSGIAGSSASARLSLEKAQVQARHTVWEQAWAVTEERVKDQVAKQAKARDDRAQALLEELEAGSELRKRVAEVGDRHLAGLPALRALGSAGRAWRPSHCSKRRPAAVSFAPARPVFGCTFRTRATASPQPGAGELPALAAR